MISHRDRQKLLPWGVVGVLILVSGLVGFRFGLHSKWGNAYSEGWNSALTNKVTSEVICRQEGGEELLLDRNPASSRLLSEYMQVLEKHHLEDKDRKMASVFSRTEVGLSLIRILTLLAFGPDGRAPENRIIAEDFKLVEQQPYETLQQIRIALKRLSSLYKTEFQDEQQYLIRLTSKLDLNPSDQRAFLFGELSEKSSNPDNKLNKVVALSSLLQLNVDPSSVEGVLKEVLAGESNYSTKLLLLDIYESKHPASAERLRNDFGLQ